MLHTSELFYVVGNHIVSYADDTTIYAVIFRQLLRSEVMKSLNQDLAEINSWCLKWHMKLNPKKTQVMVASRSWFITTGYGDLTLGGAELERVNGLRNFGVTLTHLREVVSKAARSVGVMRRA